MASLIEVYFTTANLEKMLQESKGKGLSVTLNVADEPNKYGQNVSAYKSQSKEERMDKAQRTYFGNGKVLWHDGRPPYKPEKQPSAPPTWVAPNSPSAPAVEPDDLPF